MLRMVENIEGLQPEFQRLRFGQPYILFERHIEIADSRTVEEMSPGCADFGPVRD